MDGRRREGADEEASEDVGWDAVVVESLDVVGVSDELSKPRYCPS
jgi:hypothetical protein